MEPANGLAKVPRILVIGGGSGSSTILTGLRRHPVELTAIVTMFDSGGSSGLLSKEFGLPPFGDLRQCLLALGDDSRETQALRQVLGYRFGQKTSLNGHSLGNLLLAALTSLSNDLERTLEQVGTVLHITGRVIPVTLERAELCAELEDGQIICGESSIDLRDTALPRIRRVFLEPSVKANPKAIEAVMEADAIVFGPGDLYTSILPNLLVGGLVDAIASSRAIRISICNLMTKRGETDSFAASDFARELSRYMAPSTLDWLIVNNLVPHTSVLETYALQGAEMVAPDLAETSRYARGVISAPLTSGELPLRHHPGRTASAVLQAMQTGRLDRERSPSAAALTETAVLGLSGDAYGLPEGAACD